MVTVGLAATQKLTCNQEDFVGIGPGKELGALASGIDAKHGITGLGEVRWVLGDRAARTISISQKASIDSILARFSLVDAHPVTTPLAPDSPFDEGLPHIGR